LEGKFSFNFNVGLNFPYGDFDNDKDSFIKDGPEHHIRAALGGAIKYNVMSWLSFGLAIDYAMIELTGLEYSGTISGIEVSDTTDFAKGYYVGFFPIVEFRLPAEDGNTFSPFFYAGVGLNVNNLELMGEYTKRSPLGVLVPQRMDVHNSFGAVVGLGVDWFIYPEFSLRLATQWHYNKADFETETDGGVDVLKGDMDLSSISLVFGFTYNL
jgi:outer membrane protein W